MAAGKMFRFKRTNKKRKSVAQQALALARKNKKDLARSNELQYSVLTGMAGIALSVTPLIILLNKTDWVVEGNLCMFRGLEILGEITPNNSSVLQDKWRVDIIMDKRPDGTIFNPEHAYGFDAPFTNSHIDNDFKDRYRILKSWRGTFNVPKNSAVPRNLSYNRRFKTKVVSSNDDAVISQASIETNAVYLVAWTEATANTPVLDIRGNAMHSE